jgi:hypothetical protein
MDMIANWHIIADAIDRHGALICRWSILLNTT